MHKNSQKRYYGAWVYFITCKTKDSFPYFKESILCDLWIDVLQLVKSAKKFTLYAYCLNYNHFHLLLAPNESVANISQIMQSFKKNVSQDINKIIWVSPEGANSNSRLRKADTQKYREKFKKRNLDIQKFQWQKSFHDHIIRDQHDFDNHFLYTQDNWIKHDLPQDRIYHSWYTEWWVSIDIL